MRSLDLFVQPTVDQADPCEFLNDPFDVGAFFCVRRKLHNTSKFNRGSGIPSSPQFLAKRVKSSVQLLPIIAPRSDALVAIRAWPRI